MSQTLSLYKSRILSLPSKSTLPELSGSLGDLGTFIPLTIALAKSNSIHLTPALFFAGLTNIATGVVWDLPMPVQPMKAIAAAAIAENMSAGAVTASGVSIGLILIFLSLTGLIEVINAVIPTHIVCGMQLGLGIKLAATGVGYVEDLSWHDEPDCILLAIAAAAVATWLLGIEIRKQSDESVTPRYKLIKSLPPAALALFLLAVVFIVIELNAGSSSSSSSSSSEPLVFFRPTLALWPMSSISNADWRVGLTDLALPQLPLTTLNSVVSVCALASSLYPPSDTSTANPPSRTHVALSVGVMNAILCLFGAMPNCHGAGGLSAQHKFGARTGASVLILGLAKVVLAVVFGDSAQTLLEAFPDGILGVMLIVSGSELASTGLTLAQTTNEQRKSAEGSSSKLSTSLNTFMLVITAVVLVGTGKTHFGVLAGIGVYLLYGEGVKDYRLLWTNRGAVCGGGTGEGGGETEQMKEVTSEDFRTTNI
jgi:MFS superfamily sulfate permease-like transporter